MRIKAKFKKTYKSDIIPNDATVVLPISVGQSYHEGEKFAATIQSIHKRFVWCDIVLADTLQRFNLEGSETKAYQLGTEWLKRNQKYLDQINIPCPIVRWNDCLTSLCFDGCLQMLSNDYDNNRAYREALNRDIVRYLKSHFIDLSACLEKSSLQYLLEETAVLLSYFLEKRYNFILYPSKLPSSIQMCLEQYVYGKHPDILRPLEIYFKKIPFGEPSSG